MEVARSVLTALAALVASLLVSQAPSAQAATDACAEPVSLETLVGELASPTLSEQIVGFRHREAGRALASVKERMSCLKEAVTPAMVAELWYLTGMVELYEQTARGVAEGARMPKVTEAFQLALYVDERRGFDEARFGTYGEGYWDEARESLTGAPQVAVERPLISVGRQWLDGRGVGVVYNRPLRPGPHFLQHFHRGQWRSQWLTVDAGAQKASPPSLFPVPADPLVQLDAAAVEWWTGCPVTGLDAATRVLPRGERFYLGLGVGVGLGPSSGLSCDVTPQQVYDEETGTYEEILPEAGLVTVPWRLEGGMQMPLPRITVAGGIVYRGVVARDAAQDRIAQARGLGVAGDALLGAGDLRLRLRLEAANLRRGSASQRGFEAAASVGLTYMFSDATSGRTGL